MSAKRPPNKSEIERLIDKRIKRAYALIGGLGGVSQNHTLITIPSTTTAITTGAGVALTGNAIALTVKGSGNMRVQFVGDWNSLNTLQPVLQPVVTFTQNGANTITSVGIGNGRIPTVAAPGTTSTPSTGQFGGFVETAVLAANPTNTAIPWAPIAGQTITATVTLQGSTTGGSMPALGLTVSMQEIF